jgi:hypothetical protein
MSSVTRSALYVVVGMAVVIAVAVLLCGGPIDVPADAPPASAIRSVPSPTDPGRTAFFGEAVPTRSPAATQVAEPSLTATASAALTFPPRSTSAPTPPPSASTPTPSPVPVSEAEAESVVEDFFAALDQDDYTRAVSKGHGRGEEQIRAMVSAIEAAARERGVQPHLEISNLAIDATTERGSGRLVKTAFSAVAFARLGPIRVPVSTANGSAIFLVERVASEPLIADVSSVEGLPGM